MKKMLIGVAAAAIALAVSVGGGKKETMDTALPAPSASLMSISVGVPKAAAEGYTQAQLKKMCVDACESAYKTCDDAAKAAKDDAARYTCLVAEQSCKRGC